MYNLRYHIASLVSVFLALALGLVLGGLVVQRGTFSAQPAAMVDALRKEFSDLRDENGNLTTENEQLVALTGEMVDAWATDRLTGRTIVIVTNSGRADGLAAAQAAIEDAGGTAAVATILAPQLGLEVEETSSRIASLAPDPERPLESIAASLAAEWFGPPDKRVLTEELIAEGVLGVSGLEDDIQAAGLVDIAVAGDQPDAAGLALAVATKEALSPSVAAETPTSNTGVAAAGAEREVAAFDTLGSEVGRYTLITLLSELSTGYYGTAATADALFPPLVP